MYTHYYGTTVPLNLTYSEVAVKILNKVNTIDKYEKTTLSHGSAIKKNDIVCWEQCDESIIDDLIEYIEREILLFKLGLLKE
jgi:hypothetical protein